MSKINIHSWPNAYIRIYLHSYLLCKYLPAYQCMYICVYIYISVRVYIHIHICTYITYMWHSILKLWPLVQVVLVHTVCKFSHSFAVFFIFTETYWIFIHHNSYSVISTRTAKMYMENNNTLTLISSSTYHIFVYHKLSNTHTSTYPREYTIHIHI